ncbi:MAG: aspartyl protease family protein [Gemmatimonadota bacterium]
MFNRRLTALSVTLVLAGCALAPGPAVATRTASAPTPEHEVGLARGADPTPGAVLHLAPYLGRLRSVSVTVGDTTLPFIFDTGGGITLVTPDVAAAIGCAPFGRAVAFRHNGEPVTMQRCPPVALRLTGWTVPGREVGVFDLMSLLPDGVPALGGIVALDAFDGYGLTLELAHDRVVVESEASLARRVEGAVELRMREARQAAGASVDVFLAFDGDRGPLWFELDSGNSGPVLIAPHVAEALGLELSTTEPRRVTLALSGYGPVTVDALEQDDLVYDGLLSAGFLEGVTLTLDLETDRAWIAN